MTNTIAIEKVLVTMMMGMVHSALRPSDPSVSYG